MPPKAKKPAKAAKPDKPAKGGKADKPRKSETPKTKAIESEGVTDASEKAVPSESIEKPKNETIEEATAEAGDGSGKKGGKAGKNVEKAAAKDGKGDKGGKAAKNEKPEKTNKAARVSKPGRASKVSRASKASRGSKSFKPKKGVTIVEPPPPAEPAAETISLVNNPALTAAEPFGNDEVIEEEGEEEHKEFDFDFTSAFEDLEGELEEQTSKRNSIDERYPIDSNESEEEDKFDTAITYLEDRKLKLVERDFFDDIGRIPDLDEISIDTSIKRFLRKIEGAVIIDEDEMGEEEEVVQIEEKVTIEELPEDSKIPIEDPFSSEISIDYDFESSSEEEDAVAAEKKVSDANLFEKLLDLEEKPVIEEFIDYYLLERQAEERQVRENTKAFLNELIDRVVEAAEYIDPKEVLRENLSKVKLYKALYEILCQLGAEKKVHAFVSRKVADYYRRQKNLRPLAPELPETYDDEKRRYDYALDQLNCLMGRQHATAKVALKKEIEIEKKEYEARKELETELLDLRHLIQKTFSKFGSDHLNMFVDRRLKEMSSLRKEISEARSVLIQRQHIMARLNEKMAALEYIGPNLYLRDYEALQSEFFTLGKKLEEKTDQLNRWRNHFNEHINIVAHVREKEHMIDHLIEAQSTILREFMSDKQELREKIHNLKINRIRVKKEIREVSNQCGLIDKPALCIDYDETLERCITLRENNKNLKEDIITIEKKIRHYTKCEGVRRMSITSQNE